MLSLCWRQFVKWFALSYQTVVCPSCLSVTLACCGQMVGRIKMPLGTEVGLGPGDQLPSAVRWGPSYHPKGHSRPLPLFGPCLLWPNG